STSERVREVRRGTGGGGRPPAKPEVATRRRVEVVGGTGSPGRYHLGGDRVASVPWGIRRVEGVGRLPARPRRIHVEGLAGAAGGSPGGRGCAPGKQAPGGAA